jgi:NADH-quinone oxidoreductase subunit F
MMHITDRIVAGSATWEDVELLNDVASQVRGKCLCALGEFSIEAVLTGIERFRGDFERSVGVEPAIPETTQAIES